MESKATTRRTPTQIIKESAQDARVQELAYNYIMVLNSIPLQYSLIQALSTYYFIDFTEQRILEQDLHKLQNLKYSIRLTKTQLTTDRLIGGGTKRNFIEQQFADFVRILSEETSIKKHLSEVAWEALKNAGVQYFAQQFEKDYGDYFQDIEHYTIDDMVEIYCNIDEIRCHDSVYQRGPFINYLIKYCFYNIDNIFDNIIEIREKIKEGIKNREFNKLKRKVTRPLETSEMTVTIHDVDLMDGIEFENFTSILFKKMGYLATVTKASSDQGIDVIAEKMGKKIGIQAKCYSDKVGNAAIQQVVAGIKLYNCSKALVITNNYFTSAAIELANANNVILWDRTKLIEKIDELF